MSRPESRPEAVAARIRAEADLGCPHCVQHRADVDLIAPARQLGLPADENNPRDYSDADQEWVDRAVATTDPVTRERWVPARRSGR